MRAGDGIAGSLFMLLFTRETRQGTGLHEISFKTCRESFYS